MALAKRNSWVVINASNDATYLVQLQKGRRARIGRSKVKMETLVGGTFGSVYEVRNNQPVPVEGGLVLDMESLQRVSGKDNRDLVDKNTAQKLSQKDINKMKESGASGQDIIAQLVQSSTTFNQKTAYSQQKYLKKKQRKYITRFRLCKATPMSLADFMFSVKPFTIGNLRWDALSQLLSGANVCPSPSTKVIVVEQCGGLVTGSVAYRLGGFGKIMSGVVGKPKLGVLNKFNFTPEQRQNISYFNVSDVPSQPHTNPAADPPVGDNKSTAASDSSHVATDSASTGAAATTEAAAKPEPDPNHDPNPNSAPPSHPSPVGGTTVDVAAPKENPEVKEIAKPDQNPSPSPRSTPNPKPCPNSSPAPLDLAQRLQGANTLILAGDLPFWTLAQRFIPVMGACSNFAFFCEYLEPLANCQYRMLRHKVAIRVELSDTWTREYQVLSNRTRPSMQMSGHSGYVLTGIIVPAASCEMNLMPDRGRKRKGGRSNHSAKRER